MAKKQYTTESQNAAYNAGIGYGYGKANKRVPVKDENKDAFRDGVKCSRQHGSQSSNNLPHTDADKIAHYARRVNDEKLSSRQRSWAAKRISELTHK